MYVILDVILNWICRVNIKTHHQNVKEEDFSHHVNFAALESRTPLRVSCTLLWIWLPGRQNVSLDILKEESDKGLYFILTSYCNLRHKTSGIWFVFSIILIPACIFSREEWAESSMSRLVQQLLRRTGLVTTAPAPSTRSPVSLVTRLAGVNIAPGAHSALTSSPLCARLSQVDSPSPLQQLSAQITNI